jgi:DNA-binding LacI/PurR family transcriptional regulator
VADDDQAEAASYRRLAAQGRVDGVFLNDMLVDDHRFALLADLGLPAVAVGTPAGPCPFPAVTLDDRRGVAATVEHLLGLGHRRVGYVGGTEGYVHSSSRRAAWRQALEAAGVAPGPERVADFTGPGGAAATRALLGLADPPTAIVYANDVMAIAGMGEAIGLGLEVPGDLSIVGFDDAPLAAHVAPPLTTVRQDAMAWGRAAAAVLLAVGEGGPAADVALPPATPVFRASTGPPRPA